MKAYKIKPGMIIQTGDDDYGICLVTAIRSECNRIAYTHLDYKYCGDDLLVGYLNRRAKVKVIKNPGRRAAIIDVILRNVYKNFHRMSRTVDIVRLIKSMDHGNKYKKS